jgi:hypothetical protein
MIKWFGYHGSHDPEPRRLQRLLRNTLFRAVARGSEQLVPAGDCQGTSRRQGAPILDDRSSAIVDEWIRLVEIPASSGKEQARAEYIRAGTCFTPSVRDLTGQL